MGRPLVVPLDDLTLQEVFQAYRNPSRATSGASREDWVGWVFRLRQPDKRHALEFVEGWDSTRICIAGTIPWLASCVVGIVWSAVNGDTQTAFTVAGFILTSGAGKHYNAYVLF